VANIFVRGGILRLQRVRICCAGGVQGVGVQGVDGVDGVSVNKGEGVKNKALAQGL